MRRFAPEESGEQAQPRITANPELEEYVRMAAREIESDSISFPGGTNTHRNHCDAIRYELLCWLLNEDFGPNAAIALAEAFLHKMGVIQKRVEEMAGRTDTARCLRELSIPSGSVARLLRLGVDKSNGREA